MTQMAADSANAPAPDVTGLSQSDWEQRLGRIAADPRMREENITLDAAAARKFAMPMIYTGIVGLVITIVGAFSLTARHALAAFEIGLFTALAISLGSMFWVMVFHSLNASWSVTLRRQFENLAAMIWVPVAGMIVVAAIEIIAGQVTGRGILLEWVGAGEGYNFLLEKKAPYLNAPFFAFRVLIYAVAWIWIARRLLKLSQRSDETGDRRIGRKLRFTSGFAIPVFALTTAFASFDFLMSLDYRFFSTMWGVYYFASCGLGSVSVVAIVGYVLNRAGKLEGLVTSEHFHDLGKLVFAFTVFWAYISFSQYFLIWYSNIPEETAWFFNRKHFGYGWLFHTMVFGHFVIPFLLLIWRRTKRSMLLLCLLGLYMVLMVIMDMAWIIRPMVDLRDDVASGAGSGLGTIWLDIAGVVGVLGIFAGLAAMKVAKSPLLPIKDPMLHESMGHKNYI